MFGSFYLSFVIVSNTMGMAHLKIKHFRKSTFYHSLKLQKGSECKQYSIHNRPTHCK